MKNEESCEKGEKRANTHTHTRAQIEKKKNPVGG